MASAHTVKTHVTANIMKRMFISAGKMLEINKAKVDALNVFPVPDGDTGTNMSLTMMSAVKEISSLTDTSMSAFADKLAKGALRGARGNSGVILSQILKGFSNIIAKKDECDTRTMAAGLKEGAELAYRAVSKPKEGTILTVIRGMAEEAVDVAKRTTSIEKLMNAVLEKGEEVLAKTPDMLEPLKRAGVVDSGGYGLITLFKGLIMGYLDQEISGGEEYELQSKSSQSDSAFPDDSEMVVDYESLEELDFGYCTEFFITNIKKRTTVTDIDKFRDYLNEIGNSVICIGDLSLIKVHVHTNTPGRALTKAITLGELDKVKIENMMEQNRQLRAKYEAERKPVGLLAVCAGDGFAAIFKDLLVDQVVEGGQTMNPSADDIAAAVRKINAENVIVLPNNKNIIMAANQTKSISDKDITVIETKNIPEAISAMISFAAEVELEDNIEAMNDAKAAVKTGQVTFAVRDTNVNDIEITEGDIIGVYGSDIVVCEKTVKKAMLNLVDKMVDEDSELISVYYGEEITEEEANEIVEMLEEKYEDCDIELSKGAQPLYYYIIGVE